MAVGVLKLTKGKILLRNKSALTLSEQSPGNHLEKDKNSKRTKDRETEKILWGRRCTFKWIPFPQTLPCQTKYKIEEKIFCDTRIFVFSFLLFSKK